MKTSAYTTIDQNHLPLDWLKADRTFPRCYCRLDNRENAFPADNSMPTMERKRCVCFFAAAVAAVVVVLTAYWPNWANNRTMRVAMSPNWIGKTSGRVRRERVRTVRSECNPPKWENCSPRGDMCESNIRVDSKRSTGHCTDESDMAGDRSGVVGSDWPSADDVGLE